MTQRIPVSRQRQREFVRNMPGDFEAIPLQNKISDEMGEVDQLARLCDAADAAAEARDCRADSHGEDAAFIEDLEEGWGKLHFVARQRALVVVAEGCKTVVREGEQWVDECPWTAEEMDDAKQEAREWMQRHTNEMERVGWLPDDAEGDQ